MADIFLCCLLWQSQSKFQAGILSLTSIKLIYQKISPKFVDGRYFFMLFALAKPKQISGGDIITCFYQINLSKNCAKASLALAREDGNEGALATIISEVGSLAYFEILIRFFIIKCCTLPPPKNLQTEHFLLAKAQKNL